MGKIQNAYIFVADALRWDYLPESIRKLGVGRKTIAASTLSPTSFASLTSGLYLSSHGVRTFTDQVPYGRNWLLETEACETSFWQSFDDDPIYDVLRQTVEEKQRVDEMDPPFINIERNLFSHAPYGYSAEEIEYTASEYLDRNSEDLTHLRNQYRQGAERVASLFQERIDKLDNKGLLENTLIIFTSDHGEILGEYASLSHTSPLVPELVYVPTVFIHPDELDPEFSGPTSHIDISATIADVLDIDPPYQTDGMSIYSDSSREHAYSGFEFPANHGAFGKSDSLLDRSATSTHSVWDTEGGWVFNNRSYKSRIQDIIGDLNPSSKSTRNIIKQNPKGVLSLLRLYLFNFHKFGEPKFREDEARSAMDILLTEAVEGTSQDSINEKKKERLEDLGYL